jgi:LysR family transcriptional regulator, transcriptional activator for dmlA
MSIGADALSDLEFFVLLAKAGSLTAAAQQLGVTAPTVSKRLAAMERRLGVRLMNRTTRRVGLTAEGEAYLAGGSRLLDELHLLEQTVAGARATPRGLLRVHATLGFGRRHIAPVVSEFLHKFPDVEVQLHLGDRPVQMVEQGFDVAIRIGAVPDSQLTMRTIASNRRLLCAAPAYLRKAGRPKRPADLQQHRCIVIRESDETYGTWHLRQGAKSETVKVRGNASTNDGESAVCLALAGHGILLRSEWDIAPYLRSGRLLAVLPDWEAPPADVVVLYPTKQNLSARTRVFVDFLVKRFESHRAPKSW